MGHEIKCLINNKMIECQLVCSALVFHFFIFSAFDTNEFRISGYAVICFDCVEEPQNTIHTISMRRRVCGAACDEKFSSTKCEICVEMMRCLSMRSSPKNKQ